MTYKKAIRIASIAITKVQRQYVFDANLSKQGIGGIAGKRALKIWKELEEAKEVLRQV